MICQRLLHFICTKNKSTYQTPDSSCATSSEGLIYSQILGVASPLPLTDLCPFVGLFATETSSHTPVVMTTTSDDVTRQSATGNYVPSSTSRGIAYYFQTTIVFIGIVGTAANALILYAMVASKQHRKQLMIFNQNALDLFSSVLLIATYGAKLGDIPLVGSVGYWLCVWFLSENVLWCGILASKFSIMLVTVERYLKIVHRNLSKKILKKWVVYAAVAFSWVSGFALSIGTTITTTDVVDGLCYVDAFWSSYELQLAYGIWNFLFFVVGMLALFIFCYGRILIIVRRQASVMASHAAEGSSGHQAQSNRTQVNVAKTMILVSAFYAVSNIPITVYYLLYIHTNLTLLESAYYSMLFISFVYICTNPFIYAAKFEPVKNVLLRLIPCKKTALELPSQA